MLPTLLFRVVGLKDADCFIRILPFRFLPFLAIKYILYLVKLLNSNTRPAVFPASNKGETYLVIVVHNLLKVPTQSV